MTIIKPIRFKYMEDIQRLQHDFSLFSPNIEQGGIFMDTGTDTFYGFWGYEKHPYMTYSNPPYYIIIRFEIREDTPNVEWIVQHVYNRVPVLKKLHNNTAVYIQTRMRLRHCFESLPQRITQYGDTIELDTQSNPV